MIETVKLKTYLILLSFFLIIFSSCKQSNVTKSEKNDSINSISSINPDESPKASHMEAEMKNTNANTNTKKSKSDSMTESNDSIPLVKLKKEIDGEELLIQFSQDQKFDEYGQRVLWSQKREGMEYPMEIKEISKGVVLYPRLTSYTTPHGTLAESFRESWLEFYDEDYNLINNYDIVKNNPFLNDTIPDAKLTEYFFNMGENYIYLTDKKKRKQKKISDQWVYTNAETQDSLTIISYHRLLASKDNYIIRSEYQFKVLDRLGNVIAKLKSDHDQLVGIAISPNGNYALLGYSHTETTNRAGIKDDKDGFEIWDLKKNAIIYKEDNHDPDKWISSVGIQDDFLDVYFEFPNSDDMVSEWKVFNFKSKKLYRHVVTSYMMKNAKKLKYNTYQEIIKEYSLKAKIIENE